MAFLAAIADWGAIWLLLLLQVGCACQLRWAVKVHAQLLVVALSIAKAAIKTLHIARTACTYNKLCRQTANQAAGDSRSGAHTKMCVGVFGCNKVPDCQVVASGTASDRFSNLFAPWKEMREPETVRAGAGQRQENCCTMIEPGSSSKQFFQRNTWNHA